MHCCTAQTKVCPIALGIQTVDPKAGWTMTPLYISKKQIAVQTFRYESINCFETARFRGLKVIRQFTDAVLW